MSTYITTTGLAVLSALSLAWSIPTLSDHLADGSTGPVQAPVTAVQAPAVVLAPVGAVSGPVEAL